MEERALLLVGQCQWYGWQGQGCGWSHNTGIPTCVNGRMCMPLASFCRPKGGIKFTARPPKHS